MAALGDAASAREEALATTVLAWSACEDGFLVLFDVPAGLYSSSTRSGGVDAVLPYRNGMCTGYVADGKYDTHLTGDFQVLDSSSSYSVRYESFRCCCRF